MNLEPALNKKILIQTGPDLQLIAYDEHGRQVRAQQPKVSLKSSNLMSFDQDKERMVDCFSLKILALLMCRGAPRDKANLLMDLAIGKDRLKKATDYVTINDQRLTRALSELIYFSEIFPK